LLNQILLTFLLANVATAATFYISPSGSDSNSGSVSSPWKTFRQSFGSMSGGDTLVLLDGTYTTTTTGVICDCPAAPHHASVGGASAAPPDGLDRDHMTRIVAQNQGKAILVGIGLDISLNTPGWTNNSDYTDFNNRAGKLGNHGGQGLGGAAVAPLHRAQYIYIEGLQFVNGGFLVDVGSWIYLKSCGFEDHHAGGWGDTGFWLVRIGRNPWATLSDPTLNRALRTDHVLIEDAWIAGANRGYLGIQHADSSAGRRIVIRGDCKPTPDGGCAAGGGEPHVGTTFYHAWNNSLQNVFALDFIGSFHYTSPRTGSTVTQDYMCTFCSANHRGDLIGNRVTVDVPHGLNSVLGSGAFNVPGRALEMDPDMIWTRMPFITVRDFVSYNHERNYTDRASGYSAADIALDNTGYGDPLGYTPDPAAPQAITERISILQAHNECGANCGPAFRYQITRDNLMTSWSAKNILVYSPAAYRSGFANGFSMSSPGFVNALGASLLDVNAFGSFWGQTKDTVTTAQCSATGMCSSIDPTTSNPKALISPLRVEPGSFLAGAGQDGGDIGADITVQYGCDGCFPGDPGFDARTTKPLWPMPIEGRAKAESCLDWSTGSAQPVTRPARYGSSAPDMSYCSSSVPSISSYLASFPVPTGDAPGPPPPPPPTPGKTPVTISLATSLLASGLGDTVTFTATLSPVSATGTVSFVDGATQLGSVAVASGAATFTTASLKAGTHSVTAKYSGNKDFASSASAPVTITVAGAAASPSSLTVSATANPAVAGAPFTIVANVTPATATGTVRFLNADTVIGSAPIVSGTARINCTFAAGSYSISAAYDGDSRVKAGNSTPLSLQVNSSAPTSPVKRETSAIVRSNVNPIPYGANITFTARISAAAATGQIKFLDDTAVLGTATLSNGVATLSTTQLPVGVHTITAAYAGDAQYSATVSTPFTQTVKKNSTKTVLASSANPAAALSPVLLSVTVSPKTATGSVQILDGASVIATVKLRDGAATYSGSFAKGTHALTAKYSGDANYAGGASAALSQSVK
jgi:hypothetical protein